MRRALVMGLGVLLIAVMAGCQSAPEGEAEAPAPQPGTIRLTSYADVDFDMRPPAPFRQTGDLYVLEGGCDCVLAITPAGEVSVAVSKEQILEVTGAIRASMTQAGIAFDAAGTLYFTEGETNSILKMPRGGALEVLISGDDIGKLTGNHDPDIEGLSTDSKGGIYTNDNSADSLIHVDTATGEGRVFFSGNDKGASVGLATVDLSSSMAVGRGDIVYVANDTDPYVVLGIGAQGAPGVLAMSRLFEGFQGFMTLAKNGDLVVMDTEAEAVFRVTLVGDVSTFLSEPQIQSPLNGEDGKFNGGIAFDADGNFYVAEANNNHILKFDANLAGSVWASGADIQVATRTLPDLIGGIAFAPVLPE